MNKKRINANFHIQMIIKFDINFPMLLYIAEQYFGLSVKGIGNFLSLSRIYYPQGFTPFVKRIHDQDFLSQYIHM